MDRKELTVLIQQVFHDVLSTNNSKGVDYAPGKDALENFKSTAELAGITKYQAWVVYAGKHMDALRAAVRTNPDFPTRNGEPIYESIKDVALYVCLLHALMEEDRATASDIRFEFEPDATENRP